MDFVRLLSHDCEAFPIEHRGRPVLFVRHRHRLGREGVCLPMEWVALLDLLDGRRTVDDICRELQGSSRRLVEEMILALDGVYLLDNERSRKRKHAVIEGFRKSRRREAVCAGGVYSEDPKRARKELDDLYTTEGGPGLPEPFASGGNEPRLVFAPHIDFRRGGHSFTWAFRPIAERSDATIYVILGTSHYSLQRFVLTAKDFQTPLGLARTHQDFVDLVADGYGPGAFDDEIAHRLEHSIELEVLLLQHARGQRDDFSIVPIVVGSMSDAIDHGQSPIEFPEVERMVQALRSAEETIGEKVCYIISGDLAHLGPKFGDRAVVTVKDADRCLEADRKFLEAACSADPEALFQTVAAEEDARRVCGFPPLYVGLSAARPLPGKLGWHGHFRDPAGHELVSFASLVFER